MDAHAHNLLVVLGPTAAGKTRLGVALARAHGGEILSADSRQVYRRLDIGTGKDLAEYGRGAERVACHLIDLVEPDEEYNLFRFQRDFCTAFDGVRSRGALPLLVGGTGLYLEAILKPYRLVEAPADPDLRASLAGLSFEALVERLRSLQGELHNVTDQQSRERLIRAIEIAARSRKSDPPPMPELRPLILGVRFAREELYRRIGLRLAERLAGGLIEEVEGLLADGISHARLDALGLEYRFVSLFLRGEIPDRASLQDKLSQAIRHFARRQLSWFRRMERQGTQIEWIADARVEDALQHVARVGRFDQAGRRR